MVIINVSHSLNQMKIDPTQMICQLIGLANESGKSLAKDQTSNNQAECAKYQTTGIFIPFVLSLFETRLKDN